MEEDTWVEADILAATVASVTQVTVASVTGALDTVDSDTHFGVGGSDLVWDLG